MQLTSVQCGTILKWKMKAVQQPHLVFAHPLFSWVVFKSHFQQNQYDKVPQKGTKNQVFTGHYDKKLKTY